MLSIISNNNPLILIATGFLISFLLAFCITPIVRGLALKVKCVSVPKQDRWHSQPVPLLGGVAIFIAFLIPYLLLCRGGVPFWLLLMGAACAVTLGLSDDLIRINPASKLIGQILIACIAIRYGLMFVPEAPFLIGIPLTILWIAGMMNAVNLLDNMDGLAGGIAAISGLFLCFNALLHGHPQVAVMMGAVVGAALGFLYYNFSPAKIFMGDSGSMLLGYLLAMGALLQTNQNVSNLIMTLALPVLVLSVPVFDTTFVTMMRKLNQLPVSRGGRDHLSHRLVSFGLSERKAVLTLYAVSFFFGGLSLLCSELHPAVMAVLIGLAAICLFSFGRFLGEVKVYADEKTREANGEKKGWVFLDGIIYHKRRIVEVLVDLAVVCLSYFSAVLLRFEGVLSPENLRLIREAA